MKFLFFWLTKNTRYDVFSDDFSSTRTSAWTEMEYFQNTIPHIAADTLLDIGCGNGRTTAVFQKTISHITGIDTSKNLLAHAQKNHPHLQFLHGNMQQLPVDSRSMTHVSSFASLPHLSSSGQRRQAFDEVFRVLRPGGCFFGTVWNLFQDRFDAQRESAKQRAKYLFWWKQNDIVIPWGTAKIPRFYHAFSPDSLQKYLHDAGFVNIEIFSIISGKKSLPLTGKNICFSAQKPGRKHILGVPFDTSSFAESAQKIEEYAHGDTMKFVTTPNPEICLLAQTNTEYRTLLNTADLSVPDGMGILWAGEYLYSRMQSLVASLWCFFLRRRSRFFPQRVCGSDLFSFFCRNTSARVFLLGSSPEVLQKCRETFGECIVGTDSGSSEVFDEKRIREKIHSSQATVLFIAFGAPEQEFWISRNKKFLTNIRLAMGVGGSFDFIAGKQIRSPKVFRVLGIEWFWRLLRNPISRGSRIWSAIWRFPRAVRKWKRKQEQ